MYATIFFICALFVSLTNSFVWEPVEQDISSSSLWNGRQDQPKNIILFLGQPSNSHDCKKEVLNYTEPEYTRFATVISVKSCLKGNATHSESFSPTQRPAFHSAQQKCDYCEEALWQAVSDLMDFAANDQHVQSGLIAVSNFSVYNLNSDAKLNKHTFRAQHFQYRTGYDETMSNKTKIQSEPDSQSVSDGLIYNLMKEIHAIQTAFYRKFLEAFGYSKPPFETSEDQYYYSEVPQLADLVRGMLRKFQSSQSSKGFVLVVNGGELQEHCGTAEAVNLKNAVTTAMTETDPTETLIVVTSSCPEDNTSEPLDITTKVYAQGPATKELKNAQFLWDIPRILSKILQTGFEPTPKPADKYVPRVNIPPAQNKAPQEANSWNYGKIQAVNNVKNEDHNFAFSKQTENFNDDDDDDDDEINITARQPEYQKKTLHREDTEDQNLDHFFKYISEILSNTNLNDDSDEMNIHQNSYAQEPLTSDISYKGNPKKQHKGKPIVTHLPEQHIKTNEALPKFVAFNKSEKNMQREDVLVRNIAKDVSYNSPPSEEKKRYLDKMLLNTKYISNLALLSNASKHQNSSSEQELKGNILVRNGQLNEKENILDNKPLPSKVSIHEKYPSSNIQLHKQALTYANYT